MGPAPPFTCQRWKRWLEDFDLAAVASGSEEKLCGHGCQEIRMPARK